MGVKPCTVLLKLEYQVSIEDSEKGSEYVFGLVSTSKLKFGERSIKLVRAGSLVYKTVQTIQCQCTWLRRHNVR
jgi:hypothetical protein